MGWTFARNSKQTAADMAREEIRESGYEIVAQAVVHARRGGDYGQVLYAAVRKPGGKCFAVVCLLGGNPNGPGYKIVDETMGPNESRAPAIVMAELDSCALGYASQWRQRCYENLGLTKINRGQMDLLAAAGVA